MAEGGAVEAVEPVFLVPFQIQRFPAGIAVHGREGEVIDGRPAGFQLDVFAIIIG